jgi:hypothetical protein
MPSRRSELEALEASGLDPRSSELLVVLAWLVAAEVPIDEADLKAGLRRATLVLAAGGDPHREVDLDTVAAVRLAEELDLPERRLALARALDGLAEDALGLAAVSEALATLSSEPDLAWRILALALLADELAGE